MIDLAPLSGEVNLDVEQLEPGLHQVTLRVRNDTPFAGGTRSEALEHALISTHPLLRVHDGRFVSPLESPTCTNINTWPVLAADDDSALLGAAIVLPDHPQLAPAEPRQPVRQHRDRGGAAAARARALRRRARGDPAGRPDGAGDDRPRADSTPEEIMRLHGVMRPTEHRADAAAGARAAAPARSSPRPSARRSPTASSSASATASAAARRPGRHLRPHARRPHGDDRAHLPRLRRPDALRRHDRRRPGPAPDARVGPLPLLLHGRVRAAAARPDRAG